MDKERLEFKRKLEALRKYRGRHTELVTIMVPAGCDLNLVNNQLAQEKSTASNIKSKKTKTNVMTALEKIQQHLSLFKKTPENGLAVFSGNVGGERDDWVIESIIPPEPLQTRIYRCDQTFLTEPLDEMILPKELFGLVVIERGGASLGYLKGKRIELCENIKSMVPGKFRAGGQSAQRFERVREELANDFYKEVAEAMKRFQDIKNVLLGGPGPTKEGFLNMLPTHLKKKIIGVKDIGYSGEPGLKELVNKSQDILAKTEMVIEKQITDEFFQRIAKGQPVEYGKVSVKKALASGLVDTLILSEELAKEIIDELVDLADKTNAEIKFVSNETEGGISFLAMGGIGALLRY